MSIKYEILDCTLVNIGSSEGKSKSTTITEGYYCPKNIDNTLWLEGGYGDEQFKVTQSGTKVSVLRIDHQSYIGNLPDHLRGWKFDLKFHCCRNEGIYFSILGHNSNNYKVEYSI